MSCYSGVNREFVYLILVLVLQGSSQKKKKKRGVGGGGGGVVLRSKHICVFFQTYFASERGAPLFPALARSLFCSFTDEVLI